jgi:hypothetical protein
LSHIFSLTSNTFFPWHFILASAHLNFHNQVLPGIQKVTKTRAAHKHRVFTGQGMMEAIQLAQMLADLSSLEAAVSPAVSEARRLQSLPELFSNTKPG